MYGPQAIDFRRLEEREREHLIWNVTPVVKKHSFVYRGSIPFLEVLGTKTDLKI